MMRKYIARLLRRAAHRIDPGTTGPYRTIRLAIQSGITSETIARDVLKKIGGLPPKSH